MSVNNNVPALRFNGFSGDWEEKRLGKLLDITSAARVHKNEWTDSGVPFFRTSDVVSIYKGQENKKAYISLELYKELSAKTGYLKKYDLLITGGGSIGIPYLITNSDPIYSKDADLLWLKNTINTNGYFLFTFFSSLPFREYISSITHIGTISHYTIEQAKATPIHVSKDKTEQTKIGTYFEQLDTLITQHQKKHDKLLNLKKALLEKMFPKQGATTPEIRFKGFSGAWEEKPLEGVTKIYDGTHQTPKYTDSGVMFLSVENIKTLQSTKFISKIDFDRDFKVFPQKNDVLMTRIGDVGTANVVETDLPKAYYVTLALLKQKDLDPYFLKNSIASNKVRKDIWHRTLHIAFPKKINMNEICKVKISKPVSAEQTKIGNLFKQLDTLMTQHQAQLNKLRNIKQACLAQMFV